MFFAGKYAEGESLIARELLPAPIEPRSYQPLGDLRLALDAAGEPSGFRRSLDLDTGIAATRYVCGGVTYRREVFASRAHDILVVRISADQPDKISGTITLTRPDATVSVRAPDTLVLRGQAAFIESHGKPEAAIIDIVDYRILRAVMRYHANRPKIDASTGLSEAGQCAQIPSKNKGRYDLNPISAAANWWILRPGQCRQYGQESDLSKSPEKNPLSKKAPRHTRSLFSFVLSLN